MADIRQTDTELALLRFEDSHPVQGGAKDAAIVRELGLSPRQYYRWLRLVVHDARMLSTHGPLRSGTSKRRRTTRSGGGVS